MTPELAAAAWSELGAVGSAPTRLETLKDRYASHVYRLVNAGPDGSSVIAKHSPRANAFQEQTVYQRILDHLPVRTLRYYGLIAADDPRFCWTFVEDAEGVPYSGNTWGHGRLAAEWLALLHTRGYDLGNTLGLPARGPDWYLACLRSGCQCIRDSIENPALADTDRRVLEDIMQRCTRLETRWDEIESACCAPPPTIVHTDLHPKNVRVSGDGGSLLPFDWESAGWGPPLIDLALAGLDLAAYDSKMSGVERERQSSLLQRQASIGRLLQLVAHIEWEARGLSTAWLHRPMKHMRWYLAEMDERLEAV